MKRQAGAGGTAQVRARSADGRPFASSSPRVAMTDNKRPSGSPSYSTGPSDGGVNTHPSSRRSDSPSPAAPPPSGRRASWSREDFDFLRQLGHSASGEVWLCRCRRSQKAYVMKIVSLRGKDRTRSRHVQKEATVLKHCRGCPNVVSFITAFLQHGCLHICMEFCGGGDLQTLVDKLRKKSSPGSEGSPLPELELWSYARQLLSAVSALHAKGVIHRDLKPRNVFLTPPAEVPHKPQHGSVRVGDFGVAKIFRQKREKSSVNEERVTQQKWPSKSGKEKGREKHGKVAADGDSQTLFSASESLLLKCPAETGGGIGTPLFMSPEMVMREAYDSKVDIWALGCLLYLLSTLQLPFQAQSIKALEEAIVNRQPQPLPMTLSLEWRRLVSKLMSKKAMDRPTASEALRMFPEHVEKELAQTSTEGSAGDTDLCLSPSQGNAGGRSPRAVSPLRTRSDSAEAVGLWAYGSLSRQQREPRREGQRETSLGRLASRSLSPCVSPRQTGGGLLRNREMDTRILSSDVKEGGGGGEKEESHSSIEKFSRNAPKQTAERQSGESSPVPLPPQGVQFGRSAAPPLSVAVSLSLSNNTSNTSASSSGDPISSPSPSAPSPGGGGQRDGQARKAHFNSSSSPPCHPANAVALQGPEGLRETEGLKKENDNPVSFSFTCPPAAATGGNTGQNPHSGGEGRAHSPAPHTQEGGKGATQSGKGAKDVNPVVSPTSAKPLKESLERERDDCVSVSVSTASPSPSSVRSPDPTPSSPSLASPSGIHRLSSPSPGSLRSSPSGGRTSVPLPLSPAGSATSPPSLSVAGSPDVSPTRPSRSSPSSQTPDHPSPQPPFTCLPEPPPSACPPPNQSHTPIHPHPPAGSLPVAECVRPAPLATHPSTPPAAQSLWGGHSQALTRRLHTTDREPSGYPSSSSSACDALGGDGGKRHPAGHHLCLPVGRVVTEEGGRLLLTQSERVIGRSGRGGGDAGGLSSPSAAGSMTPHHHPSSPSFSSGCSPSERGGQGFVSVCSPSAAVGAGVSVPVSAGKSLLRPSGSPRGPATSGAASSSSTCPGNTGGLSCSRGPVLGIRNPAFFAGKAGLSSSAVGSHEASAPPVQVQRGRGLERDMERGTERERGRRNSAQRQSKKKSAATGGSAANRAVSAPRFVFPPFPNPNVVGSSGAVAATAGVFPGSPPGSTDARDTPTSGLPSVAAKGPREVISGGGGGSEPGKRNVVGGVVPRVQLPLGQATHLSSGSGQRVPVPALPKGGGVTAGGVEGSTTKTAPLRSTTSPLATSPRLRQRLVDPLAYRPRRLMTVPSLDGSDGSKGTAPPSGAAASSGLCVDISGPAAVKRKAPAGAAVSPSRALQQKEVRGGPGMPLLADAAGTVPALAASAFPSAGPSCHTGALSDRGGTPVSMMISQAAAEAPQGARDIAAAGAGSGPAAGLYA